VPSAGFDGGWYAKAVLTGAHVINWVVDDEAALRTSLLNGVSGFITNEPGRMLRALHDTQLRCERT
jgi:glycerophosphoryl diester phosphodiesterase